MKDFVTYVVEVYVDGLALAVVDVPTALGPDAAERRARYAIASRHPNVDLDRITTRLQKEAIA